LKDLYKKGLLYKGYTIQPYSPAAGTGLSSHELNQPGTYKDVKDTTIVAEFRLDKAQIHPVMDRLVDNEIEDVAFIAWTTTPWTLPSNTALVVRKNIDSVKIKTFKQYTRAPVSVVLAKSLLQKHIKAEGQQVTFQDYKLGDKVIPWEVAAEFKGEELAGLRYHQLMPYITSHELMDKAFRVIIGDFVTTEDGTGIVHAAPTYGGDDFKVARENGVPAILVKDENGKDVPTVDRTGRFV